MSDEPFPFVVFIEVKHAPVVVYDGLTVLIRDSVCVFVVVQSGDDEVKITVFVIIAHGDVVARPSAVRRAVDRRDSHEIAFRCGLIYFFKDIFSVRSDSFVLVQVGDHIVEVVFIVHGFYSGYEQVH